MATTIRGEVNEAIFAGITGRMGIEGRRRAQGLLDTAGSDGRSMFNRLKKPAQRATWSRFKAQAEYLDEVDALGDTACWMEGVAPSKVADFAGEAAAQDIDTLSRYGDAKKLALVACLAHTARMQARDTWPRCCASGRVDRQESEGRAEEIRLRQRAVTEQLIGTYRTVLENLDLDGEAVAGEPGQACLRGRRGRGGRRVRRPAVGHRGGVGLPRRQLRGAGAPVLPKGPRRDVRAGRQAHLVATSSDDSVLAALEHARAYHAARRNHIPVPPPAPTAGRPTWAWRSRRGTGGARSPTGAARAWWCGSTSRRWCSPTWPRNCALATSRSRAGEYADWRANLLPWEECESLLEGFCAGVGLPATASGFTERLKHVVNQAAGKQLTAG